jgi:hypothetical protein
MLHPIIRKRLRYHWKAFRREVKNTMKARHSLKAAQEVMTLLGLEEGDEVHQTYLSYASYLPGWTISISPREASPNYMTPLLRKVSKAGFHIIYAQTEKENSTWSWHVIRDNVKVRLEMSFSASMTCQLVETGEYKSVPVRKLVCTS